MIARALKNFFINLRFLSLNLNVMDMTAASLCQDNGIKILVFSMKDPDNIKKAMLGENIGTLVE